MPEVVQTPDCGLIFADFKIDFIESALPREQILTAVALDYNPNVIVVIQTDDMSFSDQEMSPNVVINGDTANIEAQPLILHIEFVSPPPQFDRKGFKVDPVTCSEQDATWKTPLPPIRDADTQVVTIEMTSQTELFAYSEED